MEGTEDTHTDTRSLRTHNDSTTDLNRETEDTSAVAAELVGMRGRSKKPRRAEAAAAGSLRETSKSHAPDSGARPHIGEAPISEIMGGCRRGATASARTRVVASRAPARTQGPAGEGEGRGMRPISEIIERITAATARDSAETPDANTQAPRR